MSYGWKYALPARIVPGDGVMVPAQGASNVDCVHDQAEVTVGNQVLKEGTFSITVDDPTPGLEKINVKNQGANAWRMGQEIYVYAPSISVEAAAIKQGLKNTVSVEELDMRVDTLEESAAPAKSKNAKK